MDARPHPAARHAAKQAARTEQRLLARITQLEAGGPVDCGPVVHPDGMVNQIEGVVGFALSHLFYEEVKVKDGGIGSSNFDDYPILRLSETPEINVHLVKSNEPIGGIGEPGYPPLGPAVLNALFDVTGTRVKKLPLAPTIGIQG